MYSSETQQEPINHKKLEANNDVSLSFTVIAVDHTDSQKFYDVSNGYGRVLLQMYGGFDRKTALYKSKSVNAKSKVLSAAKSGGGSFGADNDVMRRSAPSYPSLETNEPIGMYSLQ
jgi:hypothetical protein